MKTILEILTFAERVRKASVTFYGTLAPFVTVLSTQDISTPVGVLSAISVLLVTAGTYFTRNA